MADKNSFVLFYSMYPAVKNLPDNELGMLFRAIMAYEIDGELIDLPPMAKMAFFFVQDQLNRMNDKYLKKRKANAENGKMGGRPKKNNDLEDSEENNPTKAKKPTGLFEKRKNPTKGLVS